MKVFVVIVIVGLILPAFTRRAEAAWQLSQITVGDGQGGSISYPAYKQELRVPGGSYTMPFGLAQMNNGQVAMIGCWSDGTLEYPVITSSDNAGKSWSSFRVLPDGGGTTSRPIMLTYLGGGNLSYLFGSKTYFSSDYGETWPSSVSGQLGNDVTNFSFEGNAGVDRDASGNAVRLNEIGYSYLEGVVYPYTSLFGYSTDGGVTWQGQVTPPAWTYTVNYNGTDYTRGTSEGSVVRAANGWLVASLRTDALPQYSTSAVSSALEGVAVSISQDNGQTWSALNRLYDAGRHHANLQRLPNNDLLMTMIVRNDIRSDGYSHNRGCDALVSHDNGLTWNLDRRITLDAFDYYDPSNPFYGDCGHVASTVLTDGSVLAAYGKYYNETNGAAVLVKWNPAELARKVIYSQNFENLQAGQLVGQDGWFDVLDGTEIHVGVGTSLYNKQALAAHSGNKETCYAARSIGALDPAEVTTLMFDANGFHGGFGFGAADGFDKAAIRFDNPGMAFDTRTLLGVSYPDGYDMFDFPSGDHERYKIVVDGPNGSISAYYDFGDGYALIGAQYITAEQIAGLSCLAYYSTYYSFSGAGFGVDNILLTTAPEPSAFVLLTCGLMGLAAYAWRKRMASMI